MPRKQRPPRAERTAIIHALVARVTDPAKALIDKMGRYFKAQNGGYPWLTK